MKLKIVGLDISLNNLGAAIGTYDTESKKIEILQCDTFSPKVPTGKQVRQNSKDLEVAKQLYTALSNISGKVDVVCIELPVGSQTARAMASYGICIGVVGALMSNVPLVIQVMPLENKLTVGNRTATKQEVIDWVLKQQPNIPLSQYRGGINSSKAEHQADAVVTIHSAIKTDLFKALLIGK